MFLVNYKSIREYLNTYIIFEQKLLGYAELVGEALAPPLGVKCIQGIILGLTFINIKVFVQLIYRKNYSHFWKNRYM